MSGAGTRSVKKITRQASIGQQGVNLIEKIVLRMGSAWHALNASLDAGIDGQIELVDPLTREATNSIIRVQSKATVQAFPQETPDGFAWPCDERDLEYWMSGNAPVILVVSRPHLDEAYWVSVKDYFSTPERKKERRVQFDRRTMRFTPDSYSELAALAIPKDAGVYFAPRPRPEILYSNLLAIDGIPERLWLGETALRRRGEVQSTLRAGGSDAREFVLKEKRILAAHDLSEPPWSSFVDRGSVEEFDSAHWAQSDDPDLRGLFVEFLSRCLVTRCWQIDVDARKERNDDMYFFRPSRDLSAISIPYRSIKETTSRTVFGPYGYKTVERAGEVSYYRHSAFIGKFRRFGSQWFLEITPTYFFTHDGRKRHTFYESKLKGIKALEKNATVLGQVVMWAALLRGREEGDEGMFAAPPYPYLRFGQLATFESSVGIEDDSWLPNEEADSAESVSATGEDLPLFADPDPYAESE